MAHLSVRKDSESSLASTEHKDHKPGKVKHFFKGIMPTLSKLSKAFLLPIALLPIAGVFLGVGAAIANAADSQTALWYFGTVLNKMGDVCFGNLPILFTMSVAMAYTKDAGVAALTAVVGFLVMNGMQAALLGVGTPDQYGNPTWTLLFHKDIPNGLITSNIGVNSLNTGVFAGIFVGAIAAGVYNKFHKTQLPQAISFFSGTKLVPIITFFAVIPLSFIFMILWPWIGKGLATFGTESGKLPMGLDSFVFEIAERSLVPFGLHHVFYAPLWWTNAGGSISQTFNNANDVWSADLNAMFNGIKGTQWLTNWIGSHSEWASTYSVTLDQTGWNNLYQSISNNPSKDVQDLWAAMGDQTMMAKTLANLKVINFTDLQDLGLNLGRFQSGKFGFMLLGLPMAALAMWLTVPKQNRKQVMGIYISAAFTCFLTGITEPIEYTFLFLAPWLFYGVHMPLAAVSFLLAGMLHTHVSMTVSGGFIDYIVFGVIPYFSGAVSGSDGWLSMFGVLFVSVGMGPIYFFAFYFAVKYGKVMVPGRDTSTDGADAKLFTKDDYKAQHGQNRDGSPLESNSYTSSKSAVETARYDKAAKIIHFLGGQTNVVDVDACASRLRVTVKDSSIVNKDGIMSLGGSTGALIRGTSVQVIYGGEQEAIKPRMIEILSIQRKQAKMGVSAVSNSNTPIASTTPSLKVMLVDENMMVDCPKCGEKFQVELINDHMKQKSVTKKPTAKKIVAKKETTKPVVKKAVAKPVAKKETTKPVAKKTAAKPVDAHKESADFLKNVEAKYKKELAAKKPVKSADKNMSSAQRAKVDGSDSITEARSELQKHANQLRKVAKDRKIKVKNVNLRDMTKKELITYMQTIANTINSAK